MTKKVIKLAIVYCRVSTEEQVNKGLSLDVQESACKDAIQKDGLKLIKVIRDEGKSAGSLNRPGIQEIIKLTAGQKIHAVYTISGDRLARNTMDYLCLRDLFRKNNVELKYIYQPNSDDSAVSRTMDTVMASFNEMQRLVISEKVKKTLYAKAEAGYFPTTAPIGYKNVDNPDTSASKLARKIIVPDNSAPLITEAFKLYATGNFNGYDLNELMYEKGLRTKQELMLSPSRFYELMKNRLYIGELHWGEINVEKAKHEPLIDKGTFDCVQSIMTGHNHHACRRRKYTWLLNGFVYCDKQQKRYTAEWHLNKKLAYYHCTNRFGCGKYIETNKLEDKIAEKFKDLEFNDNFVEQVIEKAKSIFYKRRREYEAKKQALTNQKTAYEAKLRVAENKLFSGVISDEDFTRIRGEANTEINNIDDRLAELETRKNTQTDVAQEIIRFTKNIFKTYSSASPTLKRHYLNFFWERFEVADGVIIKSIPTLLFRELLRLEQVFIKTENPQIDENLRRISSVIITNSLLPG